MSFLSRILVLLLLTTLTAARADDGWQSLFDGKTLNGWRASEHAATWRVDGGALVASGPRSHLYYVGAGRPPAPKNIELETEVMTPPGANSGN